MKTALELYNKIPVSANPEEFVAGHGNWGLSSTQYNKARRLAQAIVDGDMKRHLGLRYDEKVHSKEFVFETWSEGNVVFSLIGFIDKNDSGDARKKIVTSYMLGMRVQITLFLPNGEMFERTLFREATSSPAVSSDIMWLNEVMKNWPLYPSIDISAVLEEYIALLNEANLYDESA